MFEKTPKARTHQQSKKYLAYYDNGHDYGEFEFYSTHRAGSKGNLEDAKEEAESRYGKRARSMAIRGTQRWDAE